MNILLQTKKFCRYQLGGSSHSWCFLGGIRQIRLHGR